MSCDGVENLHQWVKDAVSLSGSADEESGFTMIADAWLLIVHRGNKVQKKSRKAGVCGS